MESLFSSQDPAAWAAICAEQHRRDSVIELVDCEGPLSRAARFALGSVFANKQARGYAGERHCGGCEQADEVERLAQERIKRLLRAQHANVQPASGSQARQVVFRALLRPGDTVLCMRGDASMSLEGRGLNVVNYGLDDEGLLDYGQMQRLAHQVRPRLLVAGPASYPWHIDFGRVARIAQEAGAYFLADLVHYAGLAAVHLYPNPVHHADVVTAATQGSLCGPQGGVILSRDESLSRRIDEALLLEQPEGPALNVVAAKAVAFAEALRPEFKGFLAHAIYNAQVLAAGLEKRGFALEGGAVQTHVLLLSLKKNSPVGPWAQHLLAASRLVCATHTTLAGSHDPEGERLRLGTLAVTARGFGASEMSIVADTLADALKFPLDEQVRSRALRRVRELTEHFPVHGRRLS